MTARIRTRDGWHAGKTIQSIVRREYGRTATIRWSADRNSPDAGMIVKTGTHGTTVLDRLIYAEGNLDNGDSIIPAKSAACGHHSHLHASDPSGSGNTPCWESLDGRSDSHGYPTNPCLCREYQQTADNA